MDPKLSEILAPLRFPPSKQVDIWAVDLSECLDALSEAIPSIESVNATSEDASEGFTLSSASYLLYNAGQLFCKRLDDLRRETHGLSEFLLRRNERSRKNNEEDENGEENGEKRTKTRSRRLHPLADLLDDRIEAADFLQYRPPKENPNPDKILIKKVEKLPHERYLPECQPRSLGLLECERIRQYEDDRGNKTTDWAEYQINILPLNEEGYYPLQEKHPDQYRAEWTLNYAPDAKSPNGDAPRFTEGEAPFDGPENDYSHHDNPVPDVPLEDPLQEELQENQLPIPDLEPVNSDFELDHPSPGRPARERQALPNAPFKAKLSIMQLLKERDLITAEQPEDIPGEFAPYKRRNKRIVKQPDTKHHSPELIYFGAFWDFKPGSVYCVPRLKKIITRFRTRLRRVTPAPSGRSRRAKKGQSPTFISSSENEQLDIVGAPLSSPYVPLDFNPSARKPNPSQSQPTDLDNQRNDHSPFDSPHQSFGPEYFDTDQPIDEPGDMIALNDGDIDDPFARMRKEGYFAPQSPMRDEMEGDEDYVKSLSGSNILKFDENQQYDWELRLERFLKVHEEQTAGFDLNTFGEHLVDDVRRESGGADLKTISEVVTRKTTGEVCRSFLSMLDLANKNKLRFNETKVEENTIGTQQSQGVTEIGIQLC